MAERVQHQPFHLDLGPDLLLTETAEEAFTRLCLEAKATIDGFMAHMDRFRIDDETWKLGCERDYEMDSLDILFGLLPLDNHSILLLSFRSGNPRSGEGSRFMEFITLIADRHSVALKLEAEPFGEDQMPMEKLVAWYTRFGFVRTGKAPKFSDGIPMTRFPSGTAK